MFTFKLYITFYKSIMPPNKVNATRNKRRIPYDNGTAINAPGGFAAAVTDVTATQNAKFKSFLGPWLESEMGILVLQLTELKDTLISKSKEKLDLVTTNKQRVEVFSRFKKLWVDIQQPISRILKK